MDPCMEGQRRSVVGQIYQQLHHRGDLPPARVCSYRATTKPGGAIEGEAGGVLFYRSGDGCSVSAEAGVYESADSGYIISEFTHSEGVHWKDFQKTRGKWTKRCHQQALFGTARRNVELYETKGGAEILCPFSVVKSQGGQKL